MDNFFGGGPEFISPTGTTPTSVNFPPGADFISTPGGGSSGGLGSPLFGPPIGGPEAFTGDPLLSFLGNNPALGILGPASIFGSFLSGILGQQTVPNKLNAANNLRPLFRQFGINIPTTQNVDEFRQFMAGIPDATENLENLGFDPEDDNIAVTRPGVDRIDQTEDDLLLPAIWGTVRATFAGNPKVIFNTTEPALISVLHGVLKDQPLEKAKEVLKGFVEFGRDRGGHLPQPSEGPLDDDFLFKATAENFQDVNINPRGDPSIERFPLRGPEGLLHNFRVNNAMAWLFNQPFILGEELKDKFRDISDEFETVRDNE